MISLQRSAHSMRSFEQHINVGFHYPVHFTSDAFNPRNPLLIQTIQRAGTDGTEKVLFIIDANVRPPSSCASGFNRCLLPGATQARLGARGAAGAARWRDREE
jgi:hypothetical protein